MDGLDAVLERIINRKRNRPKLNKVWRAYDPSPCEQGRCFFCTSCGYGCDDYFSTGARKMPGDNFQFCPCCGKAVTDAAMTIIEDRLEALEDE